MHDICVPAGDISPYLKVALSLGAAGLVLLCKDIPGTPLPAGFTYGILDADRNNEGRSYTYSFEKKTLFNRNIKYHILRPEIRRLEMAQAVFLRDNHKTVIIPLSEIISSNDRVHVLKFYLKQSRILKGMHISAFVASHALSPFGLRSGFELLAWNRFFGLEERPED